MSVHDTGYAHAYAHATPPGLRVRVVSPGLHPLERIIEIDQADGTPVQSTAWARSIQDGCIDVGWPVGDRADGALLVELPHETCNGAWRVWVRPEQLAA